MITSLTDLAPGTREAARSWLDGAAARVDPALAEPLRDELTRALLEALDATSTPADVASFAEQVGPIDGSDGGPADRRAGRFAGVPFDWRPPTLDRLRRAWWNPASDRVFVPRTFGAGWSLNYGALFVRLGLIEPDAEDDPFTRTPESSFRLAAAAPVSLAAAVALHYLVRGHSLPDPLPQHWNLRGQADGWVSRRAAAASDLTLATAAAAAALLTAGAGRTSRPARAASLALAGAVAAGSASVTVLRSLPDRPRWWAGPALVTAISGGAGGVLLGLALAGREAERARDLGATR